MGIEALEVLENGTRTSSSGLKDDPFAPRQGRNLIWRGINMTLTEKKDKIERKILDNVWGEVPQRQTTAIMGPSGSGKTSLLNILSGRTSSNGNVKVTVDMRLNNHVVDPSNIKVRKTIAFVAQDDSLQITSTPREAIRFSAKLRLPKSKTEQELDNLTHRMLSELYLQDCADTIVGGPLIKGISGGERKRTSVGVELITQPALVFLDEPTSGLDSFNALQLCKVLKKVANAGSSVLFTIHQPSSEIFSSFDHLLLLNKGRIMYQGGVSNISDFFENCGYPLPPKYNPADWIMHVAQTSTIQELNDNGFFANDNRDSIEPTLTKNDNKYINLNGSKMEHGNRVGTRTQTKLLFAREAKNFFRAKQAIKARTGMTMMISLVTGLIFFNVAKTNFSEFINVQSTFGALLLSLLANVFSTAIPSLMAFSEERPVFLREYSTDHYTVPSYFASRLTMECLVTGVQVLISSVITYNCVGFSGSYGIFVANIYLLALTSTALGVMLGSAVESPTVAIEFLPAVFMPQIIFSGFFVPTDLMPDWLQWIQYICPLTYAIRIALVNEFDGRCDDVPGKNLCDEVLANAGADPDGTWWNWIVLVSLFIALRFTALVMLGRKAKKFY